MPIKKIDDVWGETGTVSEPSGAKKTLGYVPAEQPRSDELNWLVQEMQNKINDLVDERLNSFAEKSVVDPYEMIASNLFTENYGESINDHGFISAGSAKEFFGMVVAWDNDKKPVLILWNEADDKFYSYNPRTLASLGSSHVVLADLGGGSYNFHSMCSDGDYVYAIFHDGVYEVIQAWDAKTWVKKWVTGLPLPVVAGSFPMGFPKIIVADSSTLAVACTWRSTDLGAVTTINKSSGAMIASGSGDAASSATRWPFGTLVSDGINLFFGAVDSTTQTHICTATIANPSVGTGGTSYPLSNIFGINKFFILGSVGKIIFSAKKEFSALDTDTILRTHTANRADVDSVCLGENYQTITAYNWLWGYPVAMCSDGISIYITMKQNSQEAAGIILKIDASKFGAKDFTVVPRYLHELTSSRFLLGQNSNIVATSLFDQVSSVFDGRDVWSVLEPDSLTVGSGEIYRLPLASIRH